MDDPRLPNATLVQWLQTLAAREQAEEDRTKEVRFPTPACVPVPRFRMALLRDGLSAQDRTHVTGCPHCRKVEKQVRKTVWHPGVTELFGHVRQWVKEPDIAYHLEKDQCRGCRRLAAVFRADEVLGRWAELARQEMAGFGKRLQGALTTCFNTVTRTVLPVGKVAFITRPAWSPAGSRFECSDGFTTGFLYQEAGSFWLLLERGDLQAVAYSLLYVVLADDAGRIVWQLFLMLHPGLRERGHLARVRLPEPPPAGAAPVGLIVSVELLHGKEMAQLLRESFRAAKHDDPAAVSSWQAWARRALERSDLEPRVRQALQEIGRQR
jgi:hypothetical protein